MKAIRDGIVTREEVFVTTKVMPSNYDRAYKSIDDSLKRLGLDYIDLMLIHQSGSNDTEVYKALCQGVKDGKRHLSGNEKRANFAGAVYWRGLVLGRYGVSGCKGEGFSKPFV